MPNALDDFLAAHATRAWSWGGVDCSMVLADWAVTNGHADLLEPYRGAYANEAECFRIVAAHGGLYPLIAEQCERIGLVRARQAERGTIGVIGSAAHVRRQWGAIHDGARWRVRGIDGFGFMTARALGMWRI